LETLTPLEARRLALARAGLLPSRWSGLPERASGRGKRARTAAHRVIDRFGYLQLDTVSIAGARSHALVLLSRLRGLDPRVGEELLRPGEPLFEFWGHEASWIPLDLYPHLGWRRREFAVEHPWYGKVMEQHRDLAKRILAGVRSDGPIRTSDLEGTDHGPWWGYRAAKKVAVALWSSGKLAVRERRKFQRIYDLPERVIPDGVREADPPFEESLGVLLDRALDGHGWATTTTLVQTWRMQRFRKEAEAVLAARVEAGELMRAALVLDDGRRVKGWIRPDDRELAARLVRLRPRRDEGVLLSPFDPVLWDRKRVEQLFGFEMLLEIFKPEAERKYGYYCLPVLAGDRLVGRVDLKADRAGGRLRVLARHDEPGTDPAADEAATRSALERYAEGVGLRL
jgi:uncharacterized protein YcaQ